MDTIHLVIVTYSHFFKCIKLTPRGVAMCNLFSNRFVQYGWMPERGRYIRKALKVFAARTEDKTEYRFHINTYKDFIQLLKNNGINEKLFIVEKAPDYVAEEVKLKVKSNWKPRDYQVPVIDYILGNDCVSKLIGMPTGYGKGKTTMMALEKISKRTLILIKPMYIEKWIEELIETYENLTVNDILVVKGNAQLLALLSLAKENKITEPFIIISDATYRNYLKLYEKYGKEILDIGYEHLPEQLLEATKSGVKLIDEVHQNYHTYFKSDLYTHVHKSIHLSATLVNLDPFITDMYKVMHPIHTRFKDIEMDKYIDSYALRYRFSAPDKIRTMEYGSKNYSHNALETSIMRHIPTLKNYLNLIDYSISFTYLNCKRPNKKCLIFAYTKEMCSLIVDYLKKKYPQFDIRRYVSEDPWENLLEPDIIVSTLGSAGTAVDIPNLSTCILTNAIQSIQANRQSFGRLRNLKDNHSLEFVYFVCEDIPKHLDYHVAKKEMMMQRAKSFRDVYSGVVV